MGWFRKKKKKHSEHREVKSESAPKKSNNNMTIYKDSEYIEREITSKKHDAYSIPGVDEAEFTEDGVKREILTRATGYQCPVCSNILFNTKLDGLHYYCPECKKQHHIKQIKKG